MKEHFGAPLIHRWLIWVTWWEETFVIVDGRGKWATERKQRGKWTLQQFIKKSTEERQEMQNTPSSFKKFGSRTLTDQRKWMVCRKESDQVCQENR